MEEKTGARLQHIGAVSFDTEELRGNIENPIGAAQIPMGVAGPVLFAALIPLGAAADEPGKHPAYLHALTDLRAARSTRVTGTMTLPAPPRAKGRALDFEALYRTARDDVFAYVATLLRDRSAAEDVTLHPP